MKTYRKYHFHVWKTLVVNFKLLPFKQAIHLPIVIYGKTQLIISNSSVKLLCSPRFGIVKFAKNHEYFYPTPAPSLLFMINGTMVLEGDVQFSSGCTLRINDGILQLGEMSVFQVDVKSYVTIGYLFERIASSLSIVFVVIRTFIIYFRKTAW